MPKAMHEALERAATKKGLTGERRDRFVFGTLQKRGHMKKKGKKKFTMDNAGAALAARVGRSY